MTFQWFTPLVKFLEKEDMAQCSLESGQRMVKRKVAIKYIKRYRCDPYLKLPGEAEAFPLEVALMQLVSQPPGCPYVLQLLEWFEEPKAFVLVLERPFPCMDLFEFQDQFGGRLDECLARVIFLQVVHAVLHCSQRGVLHRDIKPENLVVQTDTLRVKLIDFGCGDLLREDDYRDFAGTEDYVPPEWFMYGRYNGGAATVWSLGILLFSMVCGAMPFDKESEIVRGQFKFTKGLSEAGGGADDGDKSGLTCWGSRVLGKHTQVMECKHLIGWCLHKNPAKRPILRQVLLHEWMTGWQTA